MLSAVFIYLAGIKQLCSNWLGNQSLFIFMLVTLTGLLLLSAIAIFFQWLHRLQQARVQLQKANEELQQKIDKQKQVEVALRESERRFSSLVSNIPGYFYLVANDFDYTPEFISERVCEVTGYAPEEYLVERTAICGEVIHPEDRDSVWELVQRAIKARETYELTYRIITKSGEQKWVWERGRGIFDETGKLLSLGGFVTDITERKQTEEQLKQVKNQLELFFSQSLDGFFFMMLDEPVQWDDTVDKEKTLDYVFAHQRITKANQAILEQYGATEEQFLGLTPNDFFAHNLTYGRDVWRRFFDRGRLHIETSECKLDGKPIWIEGNYICFYDAQGRITGHFGIQRDITAAKHREAERLRTEEAIKQLNNQLELKVQQRTVDLVRANQKLQEEIAERIRAEVDLKQQKEILQTIFDNVPVMLTFYDATGRIKMANSALEKILGWSVRDLQEIDLIAECYPNPAYRQQVLDWMLQPTSGWLDLKTRIRNGQFLDTSWANVRLSNGTSIGIGQDITFRKRAENDLKRKNAEMQALFRAFPDLFFRLNSEGIILDYQAPHLSELYDSPQSFLGKSVLEVLPTTVGQKCKEAIARVLQTQSLVSIEYSLPIAGGKEYYELASFL